MHMCLSNTLIKIYTFLKLRTHLFGHALQTVYIDLLSIICVYRAGKSGYYPHLRGLGDRPPLRFLPYMAEMATKNLTPNPETESMGAVKKEKKSSTHAK